MDELELEWSVQAERDLDAIAEYTEQRGYDAEGYLSLLFAAAARLRRFPYLGPALLPLPPYRRLAVGEHLLVYKVEEGRVRVECVAHAAQDIADVLPLK